MEYVMAESTPQIHEMLRDGGRKTRIIAGGTDLLLDIKTGKHEPRTLVDISRVAELRQIALEGDTLVIGGAVTHSMAAENELVQKYAPTLAEANRHVGSLQIQNVATIAGNIISAQPAADTAVALAALGAECRLGNSEGTRTVPLAEMYAGFGKCTMDSCQELLEQIRIPAQKEGEASAYVRLELRKALALPMLNVAAMVRLENGKVAWARISMAPVGVGPVRATQAEQWLKGRALTQDVTREAGQKALENANPRSNPLRGSREYRLQTLPVLVDRALCQVAAKLAV